MSGGQYQIEGSSNALSVLANLGVQFIGNWAGIPLPSGTPGTAARDVIKETVMELTGTTGRSKQVYYPAHQLADALVDINLTRWGFHRALTHVERLKSDPQYHREVAREDYLLATRVREKLILPPSDPQVREEERDREYGSPSPVPGTELKSSIDWGHMASSKCHSEDSKVQEKDQDLLEEREM